MMEYGIMGNIEWCFVSLAQVTRPVPIPFFGVLKKEKHVLLPSVADVVIEQGKFRQSVRFRFCNA